MDGHPTATLPQLVPSAATGPLAATDSSPAEPGSQKPDLQKLVPQLEPLPENLAEISTKTPDTTPLEIQSGTPRETFPDGQPAPAEPDGGTGQEPSTAYHASISAGSLWAVRCVGAAGLGICGGLATGAGLWGVPTFSEALAGSAVGGGLAMIAGLAGYLTAGPVRAVVRLRRSREETQAEVVIAESQFAECQQHREQLADQYDQVREEIVTQRREHLQQAYQEISCVKQAVAPVLEEVQRRQSKLRVQAAKVIGPMMTNYQAAQEEFARRQEAIAQEIRQRAEERLQELQAQFVQDYLRQFLISKAQVGGVGPRYKQRLAEAGIETAADLTGERLAKLGSGHRIEAITAWKNQLTKEAERLRPLVLPAEELEQIQRQLATERQRLFRRWDHWQNRWRSQAELLRKQYQNEVEKLDRVGNSAQDRAKEQIQSIWSAAVEQSQRSNTDLVSRRAALRDQVNKAVTAEWQAARRAHRAQRKALLAQRRWEQHVRLSFGQYLALVVLGRNSTGSNRTCTGLSSPRSPSLRTPLPTEPSPLSA